MTWGPMNYSKSQSPCFYGQGSVELTDERSAQNLLDADLHSSHGLPTAHLIVAKALPQGCTTSPACNKDMGVTIRPLSLSKNRQY